MKPFSRISLAGAATVLVLAPTVAQQHDSRSREPVCRVTVSLNVTSGVPEPMAELHDSKRIERLHELLKDLPKAEKTEEPTVGSYQIWSCGKGCGLPEYRYVYHGTVSYRGAKAVGYFRDERGLEEFLEGLDYKSNDMPKKAGKQAPAQTKQPHEEWLARRIREAQEIKVGMSRASLLKVFRKEGGLQSTPARRYVLRSCAFIKVDVEFGGATGHPLPPDAQLRILKISKPYLEFPIED